jgi:hypothetical protein
MRDKSNGSKTRSLS